MKDANEPRTPTPAQIDANRRNAQKSTGPRTAEGKTASSRNRLLHGLRANKHILLDEDPEEFLSLLKDLYDRFQPVGDGEEKLVLRIASDQWRLDRSFPMEAGIYRERLRMVAVTDFDTQQSYVQHKKNHQARPDSFSPPPTLPEASDRLARAFISDSDGPNTLAKLARYQGAIQRSIDHSLRQLKIYQAARHASPPPNEPLHPETGPAKDEGPVGQAVPPAEPAATPLDPANCHSNPNNKCTAVLLVALAVHALVRAVSPLPGTPAVELRGKPNSPIVNRRKLRIRAKM
jgi:hypothetical protein